MVFGIRKWSWLFLVLALVLNSVPSVHADDEVDDLDYWTEEVSRLRESLQKAERDASSARNRVRQLETNLRLQNYGESCEQPCLTAESGCPTPPDSLVPEVVDGVESQAAQSACGRISKAFPNSALPASCLAILAGCGEVRDLRAVIAARGDVELNEEQIETVRRELADARRERVRVSNCEECRSHRRESSVWSSMFGGGGGGISFSMNLGGGSGWGGMAPYIANVGQMYNPMMMNGGGWGMLPNTSAYLNPYMSMGMNPMMNMGFNTGYSPMMSMGYNPMMQMYQQQMYMQQYQQQMYMQQAYQQQLMMQQYSMMNPMMGMYTPWGNGGCLRGSPYVNGMFNPMMNGGGMWNTGGDLWNNGGGMWNTGGGLWNNGGGNWANGGNSWMYQQQLLQQQQRQQDALVAYQQMIEAQQRYSMAGMGGGGWGGGSLGGWL